MRFIYRFFKWLTKYRFNPAKWKRLSKMEQGFSLTELLIVLVIIGVLILMAYPEFSKVVVRAKETEAKIQLKHLYALQRSYYFEYDRYTNDTKELGFEQKNLISEGGTARYKISVRRANDYGFEAIATSVVDYDKDGIFSEWTIDETGEIIHRVFD